jgi:hypothetical protein
MHATSDVDDREIGDAISGVLAGSTCCRLEAQDVNTEDG